ncbi:von Willebrand factor A domain-containing protein 8-like [Heptranchias perlo]|uniref:von Willebrand factor A domain-containing protein 8-like n=1 Tax=Heptranchias perlo TaxID=212740 RepID=UPI00355A7B63
MYRFNGVDGRLERSMEAVCMVLEAFENYEHKFKYDIVGHSGDGFNIELVRSEKIPKNNKERLQTMKMMHAHAQFCMSGDHTLEGTEHAIQEIAREEADEHFVIVLSDANLERYGINPARFARVLTSNPQAPEDSAGREVLCCHGRQANPTDSTTDLHIHYAVNSLRIGPAGVTYTQETVGKKHSRLISLS